MLSRSPVLLRAVPAPFIFLTCAVLVLVSCQMTDSDLESEAERVDLGVHASTLEAPSSKEVPRELEAHGIVRQDEFYWLRERDNPEVAEYLEEENRYTQAVLEPTAALQEQLFAEIKGRIEQDASTVPYSKNGYWYYVRYEDGAQYPIYCRKKGSLETEEEVILNVNELAEGHSYTGVSGVAVSPNAKLLAFGHDTVGRREYTIRFKDLKTGELLPDEVVGVTPNVVWANDNKTVFYTAKDSETLRADRIFRRQLGSSRADEMYFEEDETHSVYVYRSRSERYLLIHSGHTLRTEVRFLPADQPAGDFELFHPREEKLEYYVDHLGDSFYARTNDEGRNFRLVKTPEGKTGRAHWSEVVSHREDTYLDGFDLFDEYLVLSERSQATNQLRVRATESGEDHVVEFQDPAYDAWVDANPESGTQVLRLGYTSLTTPRSVYDYNMASRERTLLKQDKVLGDFDSGNYRSERLWTTARDGVSVPVSLVYRSGLEKNGQAPLLLYSYGSYGSSTDPGFRHSLVSLLDRGFVYAIAHIRGGQEMGFDWYEDGKLLNKKNTFTDFIDVADDLIERGYTQNDRLFARGGSAGGLLMGAIVNMRPELWRGVGAHVPFVDVVTTMLDETIPLTTFEWDEWGDPRKKELHDYMLSYSPYDQVEAKEYPNLLVTAGFHDSQVQYWEPAKWVARMRKLKTGDNLLLLKTNMDAGHGGGSGRDRRIRETALEYAFYLSLAP